MRYFLLAIIIFFSSLASFAEDSHREYFEAVKKIQQLPKDAIPIVECNLAEAKNIIKTLPQHEINSIFGGEPKLYDTGIMNNYGDTIKLYKGNFSNSGDIDYLFLAQGGSLATDTVIKVYKRKNNHFVDLDFDTIVIKNLLPGKDMSHFYMWMPEHFAFVEHNKTYMRFMNYPPQGEYNKSKLLVCTYLWEGKKFKLISPKNCIG